MALIRLVLYGSGIYFFYLLAFPDYSCGLSQAYHAFSSAVILGAAAGIFLFLKVIEFSSTLAKILLELGFALAVLLYFGYTMPQRSGKPPLKEWTAGRHPTRSDARRGLDRLGIGQNSKVGKILLKPFPEF
ncbi:MAG: hypothetical protein A3J74_07990 [Elusimicrobia bacterium RIFCSPHIGHO2_02_FULL_57_9]|nr:MAG: hypothetical protein A3J74_07990 [Elusimicrobia bacterium RIFCSPHIGHO2_02_FULL_57_9]